MTQKSTNPKYRIILILCFLVLSLGIISSSSATTTIYVNNATGNDNNDGLTNITAKATIQNGTDTVESGGTVYVADGTYKEHITFNKNLNLKGQSTAGTIIDGTNNGRVLTNHAYIINLINFTITNGNVAGTGGGIYNLGTMTMTNCNVVNNIATASNSLAMGGGIYNLGTLTMTNCSVNNNSAGATSGTSYAYGGGICNILGTLTMTNCSVNNNSARATSGTSYAYGGGIYNQAILNMNNCNINNNTATSTYITMGGGIYNILGTLTMNSCNIINNTATSTILPLAWGGGIYNSVGTLTMNFSRIVNNTPSAVHNVAGTVISLQNNWWGSNQPVFSTLLVGVTPPTNWIYMAINATPKTINNTQTSLITVSFNHLFDGSTVTSLDPNIGHIPDGTPVTFNTDKGSIGCKTITKETSGGIATATLTADETAGTAQVNGVCDNQTMYTDVTINATSGLYLTVTPNNTKPKVGDTVLYILKIGNKGPDPARNVVMTYVIPKGLEFAGAKVDAGNYIYDPNTRTITWTIGDVPLGDPYMNLTLHISSAGQYTLNPVLTTSTNDPTLNTSTQSITINALQPNNNTNNTTVNAQSTVSMQHTGIPVNYLIMAILLVISGLVIPKRK